MARGSRLRVSDVFLSATLIFLAADSRTLASEPGFQVKLDSGHPWRPPFCLDRVGLARGEFEADVAAWSEPRVNPVDLGAILVPSGWLLLGPGQVGVLEVAVFRRDRNDLNTRAAAWYESNPRIQASVSIPVSKGEVARAKLRLPDPP